MLYTIVIYLASFYPCWKKNTGKNYGCAKFQKDLGMQLLNYVIEHEWKDHHSGSVQPDWMQQSEFLPCKGRSVSFVSTNTAMASITNQSQQPRYLRQLKKKEE